MRPGDWEIHSNLAVFYTGQRRYADLKRAELIAFPLVFLLSLWVFRGVVAALLIFQDW